MMQFVDLEEAFTEGETPEEAAYNAAEVLSGILAYRLEGGNDILAPSPVEGRSVSLPSASVQSALLIWQASVQRSQSDLARALDNSWPSAQRLENLHHYSQTVTTEQGRQDLGQMAGAVI